MRKEKPTCEPCNPAGSEVSSNRIGGISEEEEKNQTQKQPLPTPSKLRTSVTINKHLQALPTPSKPNKHYQLP